MNESVAIVFVVNAKGHTVSQILGVFVEETTANAVRNAYAELWVTVEVEAWVLDYSAAPADIVEAVMGKKIAAKDAYQLGDMVYFDDGGVKGYGQVVKTTMTKISSEVVYDIQCEPHHLIEISKGVANAELQYAVMLHSEIKGAAK